MTIYLLAHGSVDPRHAADVEQIAGRLGSGARPCYLDHCEPSLPQVADAPGVVVPLLFSPGYHVQVDVGEAVAAAAVPLRVSQPPLLTSGAAWGGELVRETTQRWSGRQPVLVTAGTRDPAVLAMWEETSVELGVLVAHASGPGRRIADLAADPAHSVVLPALVARGFFSDVIAQHGAEAGLPVADVAGTSAALIAELSRVVAGARIAGSEGHVA